jgi:hypothetical protein
VCYNIYDKRNTEESPSDQSKGNQGITTRTFIDIEYLSLVVEALASLLQQGTYGYM